jgi:hypothetical protein
MELVSLYFVRTLKSHDVKVVLFFTVITIEIMYLWMLKYNINIASDFVQVPLPVCIKNYKHDLFCGTLSYYLKAFRL